MKKFGEDYEIYERAERYFKENPTARAE